MRNGVWLTIETANTIALDVITCNDRFGSFDLEALSASYRSFEVPGLINKNDVAVDAKVGCCVDSRGAILKAPNRESEAEIDSWGSHKRKPLIIPRSRAR